MTIGCGTPAAIGCDGLTVQTSSRSPSLRHLRLHDRAEDALQDLGVVARVQDEQAHAAEHGLVDAGDDGVVDVVVGDVAPPGQDVRRVDHLLRKAVIGLVERGGPSSNRVAQQFGEPGGDRAVHAFGIALANLGLVALVDVLAPHGDAYHPPNLYHEHIAGGGGGRRLGRRTARRGLRQATRRRAGRDRRAGGAGADGARHTPGRRAPRGDLGGALRGRLARRGERRRADFPARPDRDRGARARAARAE